jgi:beta-RFAP synthase
MAVLVKTPARLHLGFLDLNGELGRLYGSIGVAIERPNVVLEARLAHGLTVEGPEAERVAAFAEAFLRHFPAVPGAHLRLRSGIPAHVGLGSGTQLALAVGTALARLGGLGVTVDEIAARMGRGVHSGIGVAAFRYGGFVVDGGHPAGGGRSLPPPLLFRARLPPEWRFVVAIPEVDRGLSGEREQAAFRGLPPSSAGLAEKLCRYLLMQMLPAVVEGDAARFGQALTEIQRLVGDSFAAVQGGRYANPVSGRLIDLWLEAGALGAGQSSWGPTVYALAVGEEQATALERSAREFLEHQGGGEAFTVRPARRGATVRVLPEDTASA